MTIGRRITLGAQLIGAALIMVSCTDRQSTAPASSAPLDLSRAKSFDATLVSTLEVASSNDGIVTKRGELVQKLKVKDGPGGFRGNIAPIGSPSAPYDPAVTPVVALPMDALWSDFDETVVDSVSGRTVRIVARGPGNGSPVDNVWVWVDGVPGVRVSWVWRPAVGGWTLYRQTITGFTGGFEPMVRIISTVNSSMGLYGNNSSLKSHVASLPGKALEQIECLLTPKSAFAAMVIEACYGKGVVFAGETFVMGVGTVALFPALEVPGLGSWAIGAYFTGWGLWTHSMYEFLHCLQNLPQRRTRRPAKTEITNEFGF